MALSSLTHGLRFLKRFQKDTSGAIAIIFVLALVPLLLAMGFAIDYTSASTARSKLDTAADAAALAGVVAAKSYLLANQSSGLSDVQLNSNAIAIGNSDAMQYFLSTSTNAERTQNIQGVADVKINGRSITSTINYTADYLAAFGPLIQINTFTLSNTATAASGLPDYLDVYIVMDNSGSMGVGATQADINIMRTAINCEIGCHVAGYTNYDDAHAAGAVMRIDVLRSAVTTMLAKANQLKTSSDLFQFGLYTFSNTLVTLKSASTDYTVLNTAIAGLAPETVNGGTNFHYAIGQQLPPILPVSQDGSTAQKRKSHVIIITDGVEDSRFLSLSPAVDPNYVLWYGNGNPYAGGDNIQAFDPAICNAVKATGATVSVLNVAYIAPINAAAGAGEFDYVRTNILGKESTTIGGCASNPNNFYLANSPVEIQDAINTIFGQLLRGTRLTN